MKIHLSFLTVGIILISAVHAQSHDPRVERALRAQKKAIEAQLMANKAERAKAMAMGKKPKNTEPILTDAEKAKKIKKTWIVFAEECNLFRILPVIPTRRQNTKQDQEEQQKELAHPGTKVPAIM
ncbi:hypothetical protein [Sediminibacterium salmoneum]|uniref:hypothetical protein n=1 Tax=Sediminibacterium salmoneum TaxID=426421 RepID=UPI000479B17C|nr:hypothetical protein [Sediminibacterium salmoneum]